MSQEKFDFARSILGADFISPQEISGNKDLPLICLSGESYFSHSKTMIKRLSATLPPPEVLQSLSPDFVLIPGPAKEISLQGIYQTFRYPQYNSGKGYCPEKELVYRFDEWFLEEEEIFFQQDQVHPGWLMLHKGILPGSNNTRKLPIGDHAQLRMQLELVQNTPRKYRLPNAAEVLWVEVIYRLLRNRWLLPKFYTRTSSLDSSGNNVTVGCSGNYGCEIKKRFNAESAYDTGVLYVLSQD